MTFSAFTPRYKYNGDGVTTAFPFPRAFWTATDLDVYLVDNTTLVATLQTLITHYTVTGGGSGSSSGMVTFLVAPPVGKRVVIVRGTDQSNNLASVGGGNPTRPEEDQFDRDMMVIDEDRLALARAMVVPLTKEEGEGFDARSNRINNLADPVANQDAVTKAWMLANGVAGPPGSPGTPGTPGANGSTVLSGSGAPGGGTGANGDFYIDTTAWNIYGPKAGGVWGAGTSLIGPAGAGTGDVVGPAGATADRIALFNGTTGKLIKQAAQTIADLALLAGATFTGKVTTVASASGNAGLTLPHGAAPSSPVNGDLWSTTTTLNFRMNGATKTAAFLEGGTFTGLLGTVASASGTAGLNIPHGAAPSSPVNGDIWSTTANFFVRINGTTKTVAVLESPAFTGTPTAPTAGVGTNTAQLATTAFVLANAGVITPDRQTFNAGGTWNKPAGSYNWAFIEAWGPGGSGGVRSTTGSASGGGGGYYNWVLVPFSSLGATETVTIGTGGAAVASSNANGNDGAGPTSFGTWVSAYGGGGGLNTTTGTQIAGGGSGGQLGNAATQTGGACEGRNGSATGVADASVRQGGGAGGGVDSTNNAFVGGSAIFGAAGGGGTTSGGTALTQAGGTSKYGGAGGAAGSAANGTAGSQPGGGGGAARNGFASGKGGDGRVVVTCF